METKPAKASIALRSDAYQKLAENTLHDKKAALALLAELTTIVSVNPQLQECDPGTILSAGLLAQSVNLSLAPALGYAYAVPFNNKKNGRKEAQFQLGWKGLVQLAQRTGMYERIGVRPVHEGEYKGQDEFGDDLFKFDHQFDDKPIVGYYAYFKLLNNFSKTVFWTTEQCKRHGLKYSQTFKGGYASKWNDEFDAMAMKTVLKQCLSKWGPMSIEMRRAVEADQAVVKEDGSYDYVDNPSDERAPSDSIDVSAIPVPDPDTGEIPEDKRPF